MRCVCVREGEVEKREKIKKRILKKKTNVNEIIAGFLILNIIKYVRD